MTSHPLRVLWIAPSCDQARNGSPSGGLAWLRQRMQSFPMEQSAIAIVEYPWLEASHTTSSPQRQQLLERIDGGVERIVIACANRLDYPTELIELLQHVCPEIPLVLACDSWWDGWRRTGLKTRSHLSLPWYRWWDGWVDWLQGRTPQLFEPAPAEWSLLASAARNSAASIHKPPARGLIVGNCRQTLAAWSLAATAAGYPVDCISAKAYQRQVQPLPPSSRPGWVLWDDSCLDTAPLVVAGKLSDNNFDARLANASDMAQAEQPDGRAVREFFETLQTFTPADLPAESSEHIVGIVAVSLPRADWAQQLCGTPGRELLVKPNSGQGLTRLLDHFFSA